MVKKTTVTIGIAAFNEANSIFSLLYDISRLDTRAFSIEKVIVYSDGSTDQTVNNALRSNLENLVVVDNKKRKGKYAGINYILQNNKSEYLLLLDADIRVKNRKLISHLLKPFFQSSTVGLVGGNTQANKPSNFTQRCVYSTFKVFEASRDFANGGNNIFGCNGACMMLSKNFAKTLKLPNIVNDDDYFYFSALKKGFTFKYVKPAKVFYKLPTNLKDYTRQCLRSNPEAVNNSMNKYFGKLIEHEYKRPIHLYLNAILKSFLRFPLETIFISIINLFIRPFFGIVANNYKLDWHRADSTK